MLSGASAAGGGRRAGGVPDSFRPFKSGYVPPAFSDFIGCSHVAGRYRLSDAPFLEEGCRRLARMGFKNVKLWADSPETSYPSGAPWNLGEFPSYRDVVSHPRFRSALGEPFETVALELGFARSPRGFGGDFARFSEADCEEEARQSEGLASYLLREYADREITFILQNWEGDWLLRRTFDPSWESSPPPDLDLRAKGMARWLSARQAGVDTARASVPGSKCSVFHAVEANRVLCADSGVPCVASHVLPEVECDMVSWSAYDGMAAEKKSAAATAGGVARGIEILRKNCRARLRDGGGNPYVYIGEFGLPENERAFPREVLREIYDGFFAACFFLGLPKAFYWQLYCNEAAADASVLMRPGDACRGFWLVRPDGSPGEAARMFAEIASGRRGA